MQAVEDRSRSSLFRICSKRRLAFVAHEQPYFFLRANLRLFDDSGDDFHLGVVKQSSE
jgi:hypothetical protein